MNAPPPVAMLQIITGRWVSGAVSVVAKLGVADQLANGTKSAEEIATAVNAHPGALHRVLRALASVGIFAEDEAGRWTNTPLSETLRSVPGSLRAMALLVAEKPNALAWDDALHSVRTGEPAFEMVHRMTNFEYFDHDPAFAKVFSDAMTSRSAMEVGAIASAFDFSSIEKLVDVGGGHGLLLASVLAKTAAQRGVLFDLPVVVAGASPVLERAGIASRCEVVGGDFFEAAPAEVCGADGYMLKHILHDWDDESCLRILRNVHAAASPGARLFVLEAVIPPGNGPHFGKILDLQMLVLTHGGRERTRAEWSALLSAGGFTLARIVETASPICVLEATRT